MKKLIALLLVLTMALSLAACGNNNPTAPSTNAPTQGNNPTEGNDPTDPTNPAGPAVIEPAVEKETMGYLFFQKLVEVKTANPEATSEQIVQAIMESSLSIVIPSPMAMPVEPDTFLQGIGKDGATFGGFATGTVIAPMMMGVPFMLYVFDLAEGTDVSAFVKKLEGEANPWWNVCTGAEMTAVGAHGNTVIIAMCQKEIPPRVLGQADIKEPANLTDNTTAIWNSFKTVMENAGNEIIALDVAEALVAAGVAGTAEAVMDTIQHDAFVYDIESWNGAVITDGEKLVFVFALTMGDDVANWTSYYMETNEGADVVFGSYNETIICMVNHG